MNNRLLLTIVLSFLALTLAACGASESNAPTAVPTIDWAALGDGSQDFAGQPIDPNAQAFNPVVSTTPLIDPATGVPIAAANIPVAAVAPSQAPSTNAPVIHSFVVEPGSNVKQNDVLRVTWRADGQSARLCTTNHDYYGGDCFDVPVTGSQEVVVRWGDGVINLTLTVQGAGGKVDDAGVEINLGCPNGWAFDQLKNSQLCPGPAEQLNGTAQQFERGWMIWTGTSTVILMDAPFVQVSGGHELGIVLDPLNITQDSTAQFVPPAGLLAPSGNFGFIWRGDASQSPGYHNQLGWALAPEIAYTGMQQCWVLKGYVSALGGNAHCYLTHPGGAGVLDLVQNSTWSYWMSLP
jgi:hypothetical protein